MAAPEGRAEKVDAAVEADPEARDRLADRTGGTVLMDGTASMDRQGRVEALLLRMTLK
jgi:hypothetical protein